MSGLLSSASLMIIPLFDDGLLRARLLSVQDLLVLGVTMALMSFISKNK